MSETKVTRGDERIVTGDDAVVTTDDTVVTVDDAIVSTDEAVFSTGAVRARAERVLVDALGPLIDDDYLPGKTRFRDVLCAALELSELEAEELVDDLERSGRLRFVRAEEGRGWEIEHVDR